MRSIIGSLAYTSIGLLMKIARLYLRVSTESQDLARQESIVEDAKAAGFYVAGIYREKASGARADRHGSSTH